MLQRIASNRAIRDRACDMGTVLATFIALLQLETVVLAVRHASSPQVGRDLARVQLFATPIALSLAVPIAIACVAAGRLVAARRAWLGAALAALASVALALPLTSGRRMSSVAVRAPTVAAIVLVATVAAYALVRWIPLHRPRAVAAAGALVMGAAWLADGHLLRNLYPSFHVALVVLTMAAAATTSLALRQTRVAPTTARFAAALAIAALLWSPRAARALASEEELRQMLGSDTPLLRRAVLASSALVPAHGPSGSTHHDTLALAVLSSREAPRSLDWSGADVLLVTVDALRPDHLGAYGYARGTSPHLDALAARGARFEHAYAPVPNTSYSLASFMTGRYMRPLLTRGAGERSPTWATLLGKLGHRTAAFYPPAVFSVDEHNFGELRASGFGFAHRAVGFVDGPERVAQIAAHLETVPADEPLLLWLHAFEPHEPYEEHDAHPFPGGRPVDAYDSEIAMADALIGGVVALVERRGRPLVTIITADHGEAFGEHGSTHHSANVYEEQVRVPLLVIGPGVEPGVVATPVSTVDLLPTAISAFGLPRHAELRGRNLGELLTGAASRDSAGFAFAEIESQSMVALGRDRLVCDRGAKACALYDLAGDPGQERPDRSRPERASFLRALTDAVERDNREVGRATPRAQGFDVNDESIAVRLSDERPPMRLAAALALAERSDRRAEPELLARWEAAYLPALSEQGSLDEARALLGAFAKLETRAAEPLLLRSIDDVRLRGVVVDALEHVGGSSSRERLLSIVAEETHYDLRNKELRVLLALGAREELRAPLERFATLPEPMAYAIHYALLGGLLRPELGGDAPASPAVTLDTELTVPGSGPVRLLALAGDHDGALSGSVNGEALRPQITFANVWAADLPTPIDEKATVRVRLAHASGVRGVWLVRRATGSGSGSGEAEALR